MAGKLRSNITPPVKQSHPGVALKKTDIETLLKRFKGNISKVADALGTNRYVVKRRIDSDPELQQTLSDERERWIDDIEDSVLNRAADSMDTGLQAFILKTQARHRGYDQSDERNNAQAIATAAFDYILNKSKSLPS